MDIPTQSALHTFYDLNKNIGNLSEVQLAEAIEYEMETKKRATIVVRLHQRLSALRTARERTELLDQINSGE